jgi:alkylated DNA repair dioxygenase AlkB
LSHLAPKLAGMAEPFQGSLFELGPTPPVRTELAHGAWVDFSPGWLNDADGLFLRLRDNVPWRAERRQMYDRVLDVPRLVQMYDIGAPLPDPALVTARATLNGLYADEPFATAGLCYYRTGRDSVAWHGDTIGRGSKEDTVIAIVSVGAPRAFLLRPRGGGESLRFEVGHGDLLVMGGSCQRTWEHAIPKSATAAGPRISVQFRRRNVW